jgi:hypothetical protein
VNCADEHMIEGEMIEIVSRMMIIEMIEIASKSRMI